MYQKINISLSDKIESAKNQSTNTNTTQSIPSAVDGSPGDSNITKPDLNGINSAQTDVSQKGTEAQNGTNPQQRKRAIPSDIQYERPGDAEFPTEQDPRVTTPTPKKKGFMESLIDAKTTSYMQSNSDTPEPQTPNNTQPQQDPNIPKAQDNKRVERPNAPQWSPSNITADDRGTPNSDGLDAMGKTGQNLPKYTGKQYNPINYKAPKIATPRMPKFN